MFSEIFLEIPRIYISEVSESKERVSEYLVPQKRLLYISASVYIYIFLFFLIIFLLTFSYLTESTGIR